MSYSLMQRFEINRVQRSDKTTMKCGLQLLIEEASIVYICMRIIQALLNLDIRIITLSQIQITVLFTKFIFFSYKTRSNMNFVLYILLINKLLYIGIFYFNEGRKLLGIQLQDQSSKSKNGPGFSCFLNIVRPSFDTCLKYSHAHILTS